MFMKEQLTMFFGLAIKFKHKTISFVKFKFVEFHTPSGN